MSANNGVIRIGRKGLKKFAFGDDGPVFEVDVVVAFQQWIIIDNNFRPEEEDEEGSRPVPLVEIPAWLAATQAFAKQCQGDRKDAVGVTVSEARDFIARLREQYDDLAVFFQAKSREERVSPVTSGAELHFSVEEQTQS